MYQHSDSNNFHETNFTTEDAHFDKRCLFSDTCHDVNIIENLNANTNINLLKNTQI